MANENQLHPFWRNVLEGGEHTDWLWSRYQYLRRLAEGNRPFPSHVPQLARDVLSGDIGALDFLHDHLVEHGTPIDLDEAKRFQPLRAIFERLTGQQQQLKRRFAARKAPAGGLIQRGLSYLGGRFLPAAHTPAEPPEPDSLENWKARHNMTAMGYTATPPKLPAGYQNSQLS